jgi:hypothetical protein
MKMRVVVKCAGDWQLQSRSSMNLDLFWSFTIVMPTKSTNLCSERGTASCAFVCKWQKSDAARVFVHAVTEHYRWLEHNTVS